MITTKRVAAVLAAAAIAGLGIQSAGAQTTTTLAAGATNQAPVVVNTRVSGPVPAGVAGAEASFLCTNPTQVLPKATFGVGGGTATIFVATQAAPTAACTITVAITGTANLSAGRVTISVGGAVAPVAPATSVAWVRANGAVTAGPVAIPTNGTVVNVDILFPSVTVRKVVNGEEPVAGFAYPMTIACSNPAAAVTAAGFIVTAAGIYSGKTYAAGQLAINQALAPGTTLGVGSTTTATATVPGGTATALNDNKTWQFVHVLPAFTSTSSAVVAGNPSLGVSPGAVASVAGLGTITLLGNPSTRQFFFSGVGGTFYGKTYAANQLVMPNAPVGGTTFPSGVVHKVSTGGVSSIQAPGGLEYFDGSPASLSDAGLLAAVNGTPFVPGAPATFNFDVTGGGRYTGAFVEVTVPLATGAGIQNITVRYYDGAVVPTTGALRDALIAALTVPTTVGTLTPNATVLLDGRFTLVGGAQRVFGINDFPGMTGATVCEVTELNNQGGVTSYSSTNGALAALPGVQAGAVFKSALTASGETITVTNSFVGDMIVSKVVTGDPKSNIAIYEISVACNQGGPKETFVLRDRQSRVFNGIITGTSCLVTETKSDGAEVSYNDNSGDNTTDGRVVIKRNVTTCEKGIIGQENNCLASVIVTNSYNVTTTTAAPAAPTTVATTAAPATTAPVVDEAPAQEIVEEPTFTG